MKVTAYIEKGADGFCVYSEGEGYGFNGCGDTEEEAKENFLDAYTEFFGKGWCEDNLEFEFKRKRK